MSKRWLYSERKPREEDYPIVVCNVDGLAVVLEYRGDGLAVAALAALTNAGFVLVPADALPSAEEWEMLKQAAHGHVMFGSSHVAEWEALHAKLSRLSAPQPEREKS